MTDTTTGLKVSAQEILDRKILLLDGGLGTTLEDEHDVKFTSEETPLWSSHLLISSPDTLLQVQSDFANAGADVILTATYQASYHGMAKTPAVSHWKYNVKEPWNAPAEAKDLLISAVSIAKDAVKQTGSPGLVALSLGAYGATLVPSQEYSGRYGDLFENIHSGTLPGFHWHRLNAFVQDDAAWKDIDIIAFETLPRLDEIGAVRRIMRHVETLAQGKCLINGYEIPEEREFDVKPYWISCVFPNDNDRLPDGSTIEDVVSAMLMEDIDSSPLPYAIGINCTKVHKISRLVKKFEEAADKFVYLLPRLVIYPDGAGGLVYDTATQKWVGDGSVNLPWDEQVFEIVKEIHERGMWTGILVGGCCKTTPKHIAKLRTRLDDWGGEMDLLDEGLKNARM